MDPYGVGWSPGVVPEQGLENGTFGGTDVVVPLPPALGGKQGTIGTSGTVMVPDFVRRYWKSQDDLRKISGTFAGTVWVPEYWSPHSQQDVTLWDCGTFAGTVWVPPDSGNYWNLRVVSLNSKHVVSCC